MLIKLGPRKDVWSAMKIIHRPLGNCFLALVCTALFCVCTAAATPSVHKVAEHTELKPLEMLIGGRTVRTPSASISAFGGNEYTSQWPGSYFRVAFNGPTVFFRVGKNEEILHIVADHLAAMVLVRPEPGVYEVQGLGSGAHEVSIFVATESQAAPNAFDGFAVPEAETALAPRERHRQVEFIGDSHTVGYGNTSGKRTCTKDEVWADTDNSQAFGPLIAAHYGADYQINAISGRGIIRNYNGFKADTLPEVYPFILFDKKQHYDDPSWEPQLIVIGLGTNDFSTPLNPGERWKTRDELHADFEAIYTRFLQQLRARYLQAHIIVWATDLAQNEIATEASKIVAQRKRQGDAHITFLLVRNLRFRACDWHPSVMDDKIISDNLQHLIDADRQLWPNMDQNVATPAMLNGRAEVP